MTPLDEGRKPCFASFEWDPLSWKRLISCFVVLLQISLVVHIQDFEQVIAYKINSSKCGIWVMDKFWRETWKANCYHWFGLFKRIHNTKVWTAILVSTVPQWFLKYKQNCFKFNDQNINLSFEKHIVKRCCIFLFSPGSTSTGLYSVAYFLRICNSFFSKGRRAFCLFV